MAEDFNLFRKLFSGLQLSASELQTYKEATRQELGNPDGPITVSARAHAVKGRKPGA